MAGIVVEEATAREERGGCHFSPLLPFPQRNQRNGSACAPGQLSTAFRIAIALGRLPVTFNNWRAILIASTHKAALDSVLLFLVGTVDRGRPSEAIFVMVFTI